MSKNLDKEQIISKIDILLERSDCVSICNHLNELQNLIKKDEEFVLKIFDELDDEREEDWQLESLSVSGPNCGFCIGFDDDMGEVFAEPVKDVSKYDGIGGFGRRNSTAYLFGPKSKEGKVIVGSYGELEYTGNLDVVAEWEESELMESKKSLKHIKLFEQFTKK